VRRVLSPGTAGILKEFCREVVSDGTGMKAAVEGMEVAGKTGTAQKSDGIRYVDGKWVASFAGFVSVDDPRLVCLVVLNEPEFRYHYGGTSSAVVFREIVEGINMSTDLISGAEAGGPVASTGGRNMIEVPNFFRLRCAEAVSLAAENGLRLGFSGDDGEVYSQIPGPGTFVEKGDEVFLSFTGGNTKDNDKVSVPDLRGLSIRQARRMLISCGLKSEIRGYGTVKRQRPGPGVIIEAGSIVSIECRPGKKQKLRIGYAMTRGSG
jgi:stage V sporulation protein D (sporulation-specific penicillin-binding protein)